MTYDWQADAKACYEDALYFKALLIGSREPKRPADLYWLESRELTDARRLRATKRNLR